MCPHSQVQLGVLGGDIVGGAVVGGDIVGGAGGGSSLGGRVQLPPVTLLSKVQRKETCGVFSAAVPAAKSGKDDRQPAGGTHCFQDQGQEPAGGKLDGRACL
eukprot:CAMPEP_0115153454 /NCGR_PEP_ID=MMETSP0227-20121206/66737_1 /TAXON_ID=89957 /ORGANISM="Polarella glacialis, Strain CCMP 1383" /LENGTH=101 /DNA_ID=CAMNT_0002564199 /DNA_START=417 /DNA_END=720 /DNA_ORIENTATION=-